jgi:hypothetical protein
MAVAGGHEQIAKLVSHFKLREDRPGQPIAFVADKDLYVFSRIPAEYTAHI